jgi:hypothetical protein
MNLSTMFLQVDTVLVVQMDPKFLRNQRYAKKHNRVGAGAEVEETQD